MEETSKTLILDRNDPRPASLTKISLAINNFPEFLWAGRSIKTRFYWNLVISFEAMYLIAPAEVEIAASEYRK